MNETVAAAGRALPYYASIPLTALLFVALIVTLRQTRGAALRFVVFAIWLRFILSAFHPITFAPSPLGLSWNALASIMVCGMGLFILRPRGMFDVALVPIYPMIIAILISGTVNGAVSGMTDMVVKFAYFITLAMLVVDACRENGRQYVLSRLTLPFFVPLGFQVFSVLLGVVKASEADGSASYIGGFNHEAAFSVSLAGGLVVLLLRTRMATLTKAALLIVFVVGMLLANYRTSIVAILPIIGVAVILGAARSVIPSQRALVLGGAALLVMTVGFAGAIKEQDRFADVGTVLVEGTSLIKEPRTFTVDDRHVMSGRTLIWSTYLYAYAESTPLQHLVGLGPNTWEKLMPIYAHNTLVSAIYELGVFGVFATFFLWIWMLVLATMTDREYRPLLVTGHLSFFVLNMATMPMWMIEGMILYAILCGCTVAAFTARRAQARPGQLVTVRNARLQTAG